VAGVVTVAVKTILGKDGPDIPIERDLRDKGRGAARIPSKRDSVFFMRASEKKNPWKIASYRAK
jgi:hypothetical protein